MQRSWKTFKKVMHQGLNLKVFQMFDFTEFCTQVLHTLTLRINLFSYLHYLPTFSISLNFTTVTAYNPTKAFPFSSSMPVLVLACRRKVLYNSKAGRVLRRPYRDDRKEKMGFGGRGKGLMWGRVG